MVGRCVVGFGDTGKYSESSVCVGWTETHYSIVKKVDDKSGLPWQV